MCFVSVYVCWYVCDWFWIIKYCILAIFTLCFSLPLSDLSLWTRFIFLWMVIFMHIKDYVLLLELNGRVHFEIQNVPVCLIAFVYFAELYDSISLFICCGFWSWFIATENLSLFYHDFWRNLLKCLTKPALL